MSAGSSTPIWRFRFPRARIPSMSISPRKPLPHQRWQANGGIEVDKILLSGAIKLVDAAWLCEEANCENLLRHRQALPPEAFISVDELRQSTFAHYLPILVISAPWLHPGHPDPLGFNLTLLAAALKHYTRGANSRWGVAWDFCSVHQPDENMHSERDEALYRAGLRGMGVLLAHPATTNLELTAYPSGYPFSYSVPSTFPAWHAYGTRGWTWAYQRLACLSKRSDLILDLGKTTPEALLGLAGRHALIRACSQGRVRPAPLLPESFAEVLSGKHFDAERVAEDTALLLDVYTRGFVQHYATLTIFNANHFGWGDSDMVKLTKLLIGGHVPRLQQLLLRGNHIGDEGASHLMRHISGAVEDGASPRHNTAGSGRCVGVPLLTRLDLSHNRIGSNGMEMVRQCSQRTPDLAVHIELFGNVAPIAALHKAEEGMRLTREATRLRPSSSSAAFLQTHVRSPRRRALEQGGTAAVSGLASMLLQSSKNDAYEHAMSRRQRLDEKGIFGHDANTIRAEHSMRTELMPREVVLLAADVEPKKEAYVRMRKDAAKCIADGSHRNLILTKPPDQGLTRHLSQMGIQRQMSASRDKLRTPEKIAGLLEMLGKRLEPSSGTITASAPPRHRTAPVAPPAAANQQHQTAPSLHESSAATVSAASHQQARIRASRSAPTLTSNRIPLRRVPSGPIFY